MINLTFWDKATSLTLPNGVTYSPEEIMQKYPIAKSGKTVLEHLPNGWVGAIDNLDILRQVYSIDEPDDDAALAAIVAIRNAPPPEPTPTEEPTVVPALLAALAVPMAAMMGLNVPDMEQEVAMAMVLPMTGISPEPDGAQWGPGKYFDTGRTVVGTDGVTYVVNRPHISDNEHLPQSPSGATRYRKEGAEPVPSTVIEWLIGGEAKAGQIIYYTDGKYYDVLLDHTMGWSATPGGYDPNGWYGPGRDEA